MRFSVAGCLYSPARAALPSTNPAASCCTSSNSSVGTSANSCCKSLLSTVVLSWAAQHSCCRMSLPHVALVSLKDVRERTAHQHTTVQRLVWSFNRPLLTTVPHRLACQARASCSRPMTTTWAGLHSSTGSSAPVRPLGTAHDWLVARSVISHGWRHIACFPSIYPIHLPALAPGVVFSMCCSRVLCTSVTS